MSILPSQIVLEKKSCTPKNIMHSKEKKHYLFENDNSTDSTDQQCETKALIKPEKIIGNYTLTKQIDKTSYTKIFLAKHILTGENVLIRVIDKKLFQNDLLSLTRFTKELQIIKIIKHPNIIKLLEIIETNSKIYLINEYLPNILLSYIESKKKLSEEKSLFFFRQLISALNYLHEMGISHRNISPENILLDEKYSIVKLTGFSVSTFCPPDELLSSPVGTLIYAPPEMILSQKYKGELNDIWDAGIVLYTMVCGNLPFSEANQDVNINHIIEGFYYIPKDLSQNCIEVIKACLESNPNKRITFNKLKNLKWLKGNNFSYAKGININEEKIIIDDIILQECKKYISTNNQDILSKISNSVKENKFDEFSSLYYLVFQKQVKKGYQKSSNNKISNIYNLFNNLEGTKIRKENMSKYSFHTHSNLSSSFLLNRNKMIDVIDTSAGQKNNLINENLFSKTIRNSKHHKSYIINKSSSYKNKNLHISPQNSNLILNNQNYYKKLLNRLKPSESKVRKIKSPKIYTKKTSFIINRAISAFEMKNSTLNVNSINRIDKKVINKNKISKEKFKKRKIESNNENSNSNVIEIKTLNTLFVNRVKNIDNNFYELQKKKNKSGEGFYLSSKIKNKTKSNFITINKKDLFMNVRNTQNNEKNDNIDKILMDDQPVANFSINFNKAILNGNIKNMTKNLYQNDLLRSNYDSNETECYNTQAIIKKQNKNAKSYKCLDSLYDTPKKLLNNSTYSNKFNLNFNLNKHFRVKSPSNGNNFVSNSFYKLKPNKQFINSGALRNTVIEKHYNNTIYNHEKTLNKYKSLGGIRFDGKTTENKLEKKYSQNTFIFNNKNKIKNNNKLLETSDKKISSCNKYYKKIKKKIPISKISKSTKNKCEDINILDLNCLKFSKYNDLIDKICNTLRKNRIKYCFINQNKIHCSGRTGLFFDIEIYEMNNKMVNFNQTNMSNNINFYKKNNISIGNNNNKISVNKLGYTSFGFKKMNKNNTSEDENEKKLYYITFCNKKNDFIDFKKKNNKLIQDMLY